MPGNARVRARAVVRFHPLLGWEGAEARPGRAVGRRPIPVSLRAKRGVPGAAFRPSVRPGGGGCRWAGPPVVGVPGALAQVVRARS
jgi:hypothetical protein